MSIEPSRLSALPLEGETCRSAFESAEALELLAQRRSTPIAHLSEPGPSLEQARAILRLAMRAPDHGKLAPWRFLLLMGDARSRIGTELAALIADDAGMDDARLETERARFRRAPCVIGVVSRASVHPKIPVWEQELSAGAVCFQILLAAHAFGFAGTWLTEWPAYDPRAKAPLGLLEHDRMAGFIYLGSASQHVIERARPDLDQILTVL